MPPGLVTHRPVPLEAGRLSRMLGVRGDLESIEQRVVAASDHADVHPRFSGLKVLVSTSPCRDMDDRAGYQRTNQRTGDLDQQVGEMAVTIDGQGLEGFEQRGRSYRYEGDERKPARI